MSSATPGARLGIDFGTSHTTAILRRADGQARALLFDGTPLLPSAVYLQDDGSILTGRDAVLAARLDPVRFEPTPKRRSDQDTIRLGDRELDVTAMIAAVLDRVRVEAARVAGAPTEVVLTHPAGWPADRVNRLAEAARQAGLPAPALIPEPVAAARYFIDVLGRDIPHNSALVVYDFGGGTFDASVVTAGVQGDRVLAVRGLANVGGVDIDAALFGYLAQNHRGLDPAAWARLEQPQTAADRRHRRHLAEDVRAAKETLSRAESATIPLPLLEQEIRITREEFNAVAGPLLDRTVNTTVDAIRAANLPRDRVTAVLLVGGLSRIPLIADLLRRRRASLEPSTMEQPETVVAEGSVRFWPTGPAPAPSPSPGSTVDLGPAVDPWERRHSTPILAPIPVVSTPPVTLQYQARQPLPPQQLPPQPMLPTRLPPTRLRRRRRWPAVTAALTVLAGLAAAAVILAPDLIDRLGTASPGTSTRPSTPFVRTATPQWLPTGMVTFVDDETLPSVVPGPATNGGTCSYDRAGVVRVQRDSENVSGCVATEEVKQHVVRDGAIEAEFMVRAGCGGMWLRTGNKGYFVAVCDDGGIELHELFLTAPDATTRMRAWSGHNPAKVVVGLLAQGDKLTVYADGTRLDQVTDDTIGTGRVGIGGYARGPRNQIDATVTQFRAWRTPAEATPSGTVS